MRRFSRDRVSLFTAVSLAVLIAVAVLAPGAAEVSRSSAATDDVSPPSSAAKLIFIHHSCGSYWLEDSNGGLGLALRDNNYFVSDTNYGWGPDGIGDSTDIGH